MLGRGRPAARLCGALLALAAGLGACRAETIDLRFRPEAGDRYEYRYEIDATITRALEGEPPQVTEIDTVLVVQQEVQSPTADGATVAVELRRDGEAPRSAVVMLDRVGSLQGIEQVEGLAADSLGAASAGSILSGASVPPPARRLTLGDVWRLEEGARRGRGRLERLGVVDGEDVAVVTSSIADELAELVDASGTAAALDGSVRSTATTTYDLADGAIRRSVSTSRGTVAATISPPPGVAAAPVDATITYDMRVRVTRIT